MIYFFLVVLFVAVCLYLLYRHKSNSTKDDDYVPLSNTCSREFVPKKAEKDYLASIFRVAGKGSEHFKMPLSKEGEIELLMFDIWFGIQSLESRGLFVDYKETLNRIENFLISEIQTHGLPSEMKYERVYLLRSVSERWEMEMFGLAQSDYPRTKQYLPAYLYLCFVKDPLKVYVDEVLESIIDSLKTSDLADFFMVYIEHHEWLVSELRKI